MEPQLTKRSNRNLAGWHSSIGHPSSFGTDPFGLLSVAAGGLYLPNVINRVIVYSTQSAQSPVEFFSIAIAYMDAVGVFAVVTSLVQDTNQVSGLDRRNVSNEASMAFEWRVALYENHH